MQSRTTYEICSGSCPHPDGWAPACHSDCVRLVEGRLQQCLDIMIYKFEPTQSEEKSRDRWLLASLASGWANAKPRPHEGILNMPGLPPELRLQIAEQMLREYCVARLSALPPLDNSREHEISISVKVWARFVVFEGVSYIASLSNCQVYDTDRLVHNPTPQQADYSIYLRQDHLGILQVILNPFEKPLVSSKRRGTWWTSFRTKTNCLKARTDVSFLPTIDGSDLIPNG